MADGRPVPRVLHQIWLQGGEPIDPELAEYRLKAERCALTHGWQYRCWSDVDLCREFGTDYLPLRRMVKTMAQMSDVARYVVLYRLGGLYVDVDTDMYEMPPPLHGAWCQHNNNAAMAMPPGHEYGRMLLENAADPARYVAREAQVNLCLDTARKCGDVKFWEHDLWVGTRGYGFHRWLNRRSGSTLLLGDTFPEPKAELKSE